MQILSIFKFAESGICEDMALSMVPEEGIADQLHAKLHSILNDENSVDVWIYFQNVFHDYLWSGSAVLTSIYVE